MSAAILWRGAGEPVLFFPGWNTQAKTVLSWMPEAFLSRYRCGVVEWPGLGSAAREPLPDDLKQFLGTVAADLQEAPLPVVGFCMGGVAAWALAHDHPARVNLTVMVESPLHFPAVLTPLLVPGLGRTLLGLAQGTRMGRHLVRRAILLRRVPYPGTFLDSLFTWDRGAAVHYLRLFRAYSRALRGPFTTNSPCCRLSGREPMRILAPALGRRHRIEAARVALEAGGHFPAVEAPASFFERLTGLLGQAGKGRAFQGSVPSTEWFRGPSPGPSPVPSVPFAPG